jgi:hypothetical protein
MLPVLFVLILISRHLVGEENSSSPIENSLRKELLSVMLHFEAPLRDVCSGLVATARSLITPSPFWLKKILSIVLNNPSFHRAARGSLRKC